MLVWWLIEEFMLLANMAVAHKIMNSFPDKAILRRHPPPQHKPLEAVEEFFQNLGVEFSGASAGELQRSVHTYYREDEDDEEDDFVLTRIQLFVELTSKLMQLSAGYSDPTDKATWLLQRQADYCNDKKLSAKIVSDRSSDMYFAIFLKEAGPLEESGMVMSVMDKSFDVLIPKLGVIKRVYLDQLPLTWIMYKSYMKFPELVIEWKADDKCKRATKHLITLFTLVECCVFARRNHSSGRVSLEDLRMKNEEIKCP